MHDMSWYSILGQNASVGRAYLPLMVLLTISTWEDIHETQTPF